MRFVMGMAGEPEGSNYNCILAALYYLSREAEQSTLPHMSSAIRKAIVEIMGSDRPMATGTEAQAALASGQTCALLDFFDHYLQASPAARAMFRELLDQGAIPV
jgi:hypothetical protein